MENKQHTNGKHYKDMTDSQQTDLIQECQETHYSHKTIEDIHFAFEKINPFVKHNGVNYYISTADGKSLSELFAAVPAPQEAEIPVGEDDPSADNVPYGIEVKPWDSYRLIGNPHDRFKELIEKEWDWRSFYNGWLEGRNKMLGEVLLDNSTIRDAANERIASLNEASVEWAKRFGKLVEEREALTKEKDEMRAVIEDLAHRIEKGLFTSQNYLRDLLANYQTNTP